MTWTPRTIVTIPKEPGIVTMVLYHKGRKERETEGRKV
jgi:hypothetical protein